MTNETEGEIEKIRYSSLFLNSKGIALAGSYNDDEDLYTEPGESITFSPSTPWLKDPTRTLITNNEELTWLMAVTLLRGDGLKLGEFKTPQEKGAICPVEPRLLNDEVKIWGVSIVRDKPDEEGDVDVEVRCGISNVTDRYIDEINLKTVVTNSRGEAIDESEDRESLAPHQHTLLECRHNMRQGKFKKTSLSVIVSYRIAMAYQQIESKIKED